MNIWLTPPLRSALVHSLAGSLTLNLMDSNLQRSGLKHCIADIKYFWASTPPEERPHVAKIFRSAFAFHRSLYR